MLLITHVDESVKYAVSNEHDLNFNFPLHIGFCSFVCFTQSQARESHAPCMALPMIAMPSPPDCTGCLVRDGDQSAMRIAKAEIEGRGSQLGKVTSNLRHMHYSYGGAEHVHRGSFQVWHLHLSAVFTGQESLHVAWLLCGW